MALAARLRLDGPPASDPEDYLGSSLGVVFPDDVMSHHGDAEHALIYTSPHLPAPLRLALAEPADERDRRLFSHYLWNSSLLLAELIEAGTLDLPLPPPDSDINVGQGQGRRCKARDFDVRDLECLELGAGTALPGLMAALLGAKRVVVTDYPSPAVLSALRGNVAANARRPACCCSSSPSPLPLPLTVEGHAWGDLDGPFATAHRGAFDRVFACDCLWMPWQHANLRASIAWFLRRDGDGDATGRAWVVAGLHTGRAPVRQFFDGAALGAAGLEVDRIWERDCDGAEREWVCDRGVEDVGERKRWLVVGLLRRAPAVEG
ncbi:hypothetical protein F4779DRAFT_601206 [Xylariaceae sp. FL0662B]|nr:hypothetical protein F4779DRAFT_601206 [Xylariaceae sp. FL0662B]